MANIMILNGAARKNGKTASLVKADVVVSASPVYFWTITGPLKTVADRLYSQLKSLG